MAMIIVNCTSTLFWWEDAIAKNDESAYVLSAAFSSYTAVTVNCVTSEMFLEQLRNLRPMAKTATRRLEEHQQKHRITAEPEVNDLTNDMLIASKEIQRQIVDVIKQPAYSEATRDRSSGNSLRRKKRRDELVVQPNSRPNPRLSPPESAGPATKGATVIPEWRTSRASSIKSVSTQKASQSLKDRENVQVSEESSLSSFGHCLWVSSMRRTHAVSFHLDLTQH
ncbi:hypothetical protein HD806DRAFT_127116 [Xylariaceae sp. AK1471]|nr:hypothetical protein HD806DRAFT_127116 [Xylariaceae sp. AK1471]